MCCRTSLVSAAVLHLYALLVGHQHCQPTFAHISEPRWYPLLSYIRTCCESATITVGYIRTLCSSAINIVDLCSYALDNLVGMHRSSSFVHAAHMLSTPLTCVRTHCRTSFVCTTVLYSYMQRVCHHYRWLHLYVLVLYYSHH